MTRIDPTTNNYYNSYIPNNTKFPLNATSQLNSIDQDISVTNTSLPVDFVNLWCSFYNDLADSCNSYEGFPIDIEEIQNQMKNTSFDKSICKGLQKQLSALQSQFTEKKDSIIEALYDTSNIKRISILKYLADLEEEFRSDNSIDQKRLTTVSEELSSISTDKMKDLIFKLDEIHNSNKTYSESNKKPVGNHLLFWLDSVTEKIDRLKQHPLLAPKFSINDLNRMTTIAPVQLGGIENGSNTCYLASAVQTLNNISSYRQAFDSTQNKLQRRPEETDESLEQRQSIQNSTYSVMKNIQEGRTTTAAEINALRKACYAHSFEGARVAKSKLEAEDAAETLEKMLIAMDYKFQNFEFKTKKFYRQDDVEIPYGASDEVSRSLQVHVWNAHKSADMQESINVYWKNDKCEDFLIAGTPHTLYTSKTPKIDTIPEVLYVSVIQPQVDPEDLSKENRIKLTNAESISPFGDMGPKYLLKAIIEHIYVNNNIPHYIAHIADQNNTFWVANDGKIDQAEENALPGVAYYYEKERGI